MAVVLWLTGIGLFLTGMGMGSSVAIFIDLPSACIVLGGTVLFWMAFHTPGGVLAAVKAGLGPDNLSEEDSAHHITVLATGRMLAVGCGSVGLLIGLVSMLANMSDPSAIGPAMAVALLTMFYAVIIAEICIGPMMNRLKNFSSDQNQKQSPVGPSVISIAAGPFALVAFFVILASFGPPT